MEDPREGESEPVPGRGLPAPGGGRSIEGEAIPVAGLRAPQERLRRSSLVARSGSPGLKEGRVSPRLAKACAAGNVRVTHGGFPGRFRYARLPCGRWAGRRQGRPGRSSGQDVTSAEDSRPSLPRGTEFTAGPKTYLTCFSLFSRS